MLGPIPKPPKPHKRLICLWPYSSLYTQNLEQCTTQEYTLSNCWTTDFLALTSSAHSLSSTLGSPSLNLFPRESSCSLTPSFPHSATKPCGLKEHCPRIKTTLNTDLVSAIYQLCDPGCVNCPSLSYSSCKMGIPTSLPRRVAVINSDDASETLSTRPGTYQLSKGSYY